MDARVALERFAESAEEIERALAPLLEAEASAVRRRLRPLERAETHLSIARAIATLFEMYLRTLGVDPSKHAVRKELERVETYERKIEETRRRVGDGSRGASAGERNAAPSVEDAAKAMERGEGEPGDLLRAALAEKKGDDGDGDDAGGGNAPRAEPRRRRRPSERSERRIRVIIDLKIL